jgi:MFS family permease
MGAALMHTGYYFGFFLAAIANYFIGSHLGWRYMFFLGGTPALLIGLIRRNVREPVRWKKKIHELGARWTMFHSFAEPFSAEYRRRTILNSLYLIVSLCGLWAGAVYVPSAITYMMRLSLRPIHRGCWASRRFWAPWWFRRSRIGWGAGSLSESFIS